MGTILSLIEIVRWLLGLAAIVIVVQAILSWLIAFNVINVRNAFVRTIWVALDRLTGPLYRPIRRILPDFGGIDFSPLVVLLIIQALRMLLGGVYMDVASSMYSA